MKRIRVRPNGELADSLRGLGLGRVVDSARVRSLLGIPIREHVRPDGKSAPKSSRVVGPKVSIIVPAYNVADYLEDAVKSVQNQSHANLEIVIVNDGSEDDTAYIADQIAARDRRVRVIHKQNGGLGAARNTGLANTSGKYVTFVDSDDQLPERAIETLLESLERTGSDFAIGAMERFNSTRVWVPEWVSEVHDTTREAIQAHDHPAVLWDVFVCNKLFRRQVWDERVGFFPEGVLYEDQECTAKLYVQGAVFDSLDDIVYRWRFRDDGSSITQNKHSAEDLQQRLLVARTVQGVLHGSSHDHLVDTWYAKLLGDDLFWYYREVPRASEEFWQVLRRGVREFYRMASSGAIQEIAFDRRLLMLAIERGTREDFERLLYFFQENGSFWRTDLSVAGLATGNVPILDDLSMSFSLDELRVLLPTEAVAGLTHRFDKPDGTVQILGHVVIPMIETVEKRKLSASLIPVVDADEMQSRQGVENDSIPISVVPQPEVVAPVATRDPLNDFSRSSFSLELSPGLAGRLTSENVTAWMLEVQVEEAGHKWCTSEFGGLRSGHFARSSASEIAEGGERLLLEPCGDSLYVTMRKPNFVLRSAFFEGNRAVVRFESLASHCGRRPQTVVARHSGSELASAAVEMVGEGIWEVKLLPPIFAAELKSSVRFFELVVVDREGSEFPIDGSCGFERITNTGDLGLAVSPGGHLGIERYAQFGEARSVELMDDGKILRVRGVVRLSRKQVRQATPTFILWSPDRTIHAERLGFTASSGAFDCEFSLTRKDADGQDVALPLGVYTFGMLLATGTVLPASFTMQVAQGLSNDFPREMRAGATRVVCSRRPRDGGMVLTFAAPYRTDERGAFAQKRLASSAFSSKSTENLRQTVLFESFGGRGIADSPKAIDAELSVVRPDLQRLWTVRDYSVSVPDGATPVLIYSRAWYEAMATSRLLVNNNNFPASFRKRPGQTYIQTWHGTPLKRVGNDVPAANLSLSYRKLMQREAEQYWDLLLAQSPWAGDTLASAFGYSGSLLADGYPRNDALVGHTATVRRKVVRDFFGLSPDQLVVLYAPTWRDNRKAANGRYLQPEHLRHQDVFQAFGSSAVMMMRGHVNNAGSVSANNGRNCIDVSSYPDINDLFLAADVLVTDYSSVQFDFVNTGKPIIYLAPDLAEYRDTVRGFYFDLETLAPGPIVETSKEVVALLDGVDTIRADFDGRYAAFKARFAAADDGHASRRVVDRLIASEMI